MILQDNQVIILTTQGSMVLVFYYLVITVLKQYNLIS